MTIPDDFPRERMPPVVLGVQTKVGAVLSRGRYVLQSEEQRAERYDICEGAGAPPSAQSPFGCREASWTHVC